MVSRNWLPICGSVENQRRCYIWDEISSIQTRQASLTNRRPTTAIPANFARPTKHDTDFLWNAWCTSVAEGVFFVALRTFDKEETGNRDPENFGGVETHGIPLDQVWQTSGWLRVAVYDIPNGGSIYSADTRTSPMFTAEVRIILKHKLSGGNVSSNNATANPSWGRQLAVTEMSPHYKHSPRRFILQLFQINLLLVLSSLLSFSVQ